MAKQQVFFERFYQWLSKFGTVYRGVLPSGIQTAQTYLQYSGYVDSFATQFILPISIYSHPTTVYTDVVKIAQKISEEVTEGGTLVSYADVVFKVDKGSPFYQDKADEDETVRAGFVNLIITIY